MSGHRIRYRPREGQEVNFDAPADEALARTFCAGIYAALAAMAMRGVVIFYIDDMPLDFYDLDEGLPFDYIVTP